jgi:hypothetical protein
MLNAYILTGKKKNWDFWLAEKNLRFVYAQDNFFGQYCHLTQHGGEPRGRVWKRD